ncbi:MAG: hypothetical protein ABFD54_05950 [Armatimonadota bacterium]|nr:hypothetical protein [bacterium]
MIPALFALLALSSTPPGTLITLSASAGGVETTTYLVVMSPLADKIGTVYVCGSYRGVPLPGIYVRFIAPISPGCYETFEGWTLRDGRVLVGQEIVDVDSLNLNIY